MNQPITHYRVFNTPRHIAELTKRRDDVIARLVARQKELDKALAKPATPLELEYERHIDHLIELKDQAETEAYNTTAPDENAYYRASDKAWKDFHKAVRRANAKLRADKRSSTP